jgi:hypothetical protein
VVTPFPATISHDSCLDVVVRFTPQSVGPKTCTLTITTDDLAHPMITKTLTGNTPAASIAVAPDQAFAATVVQNIGICSTAKPFPVSNTGACNVNVTNIAIGGANAGDFSLPGLQSTPITLQPGHLVNEGDLSAVFAPTALARARTGTVTVTYESDPITHATSSVTRNLCGEGVMTGARVLVTAGGVPVPTVDKIQLQRINANRNKNLIDTNDVAQKVALQSVTPGGVCAPFQFHREYGTVGNPVQLLPGSYEITASVTVNGKKMSQTVGFDVNTCGFNPTIRINF